MLLKVWVNWWQKYKLVAKFLKSNLKLSQFKCHALDLPSMVRICFLMDEP